MGFSLMTNQGDVFHAAYQLAHEFGVAKLAERMGVVPGTLYNKLLQSDSSSHHKLTLQDALLISVVTGRYDILHALARTLGHVCVPLQDVQATSDAALLEMIATWMDRQGDFFRTFHTAIADGQVTAQEAVQVEQQAYEVVRAILELTGRLKGMQ